MKNKISESWSFKFVLITAMVFLTISTAYAGFGISPPYVANEHLSRGFRYEQRIILVRGDPVEDLKAQMILDVPNANSWISVDKGETFILPKGQPQVAIVVRVDVPKDAEYGEYKGRIEVKTSSLAPAAGSVGIALGGQIDVNLTVTDQEISDFKVDAVAVNDLETAHKWLLWDIPGIIKFKMQVENLGNVPVSPTKVSLDIYDSSNKESLEKSEAVKVEAVDPFGIEWITADVLTALPPGGYWAKYQIYKENEIAKSDEVHLSLLPHGALAYDSPGPIVEFSKMQTKDKVQFILIIVLLLLILGGVVFFIVYKFVKRSPSLPPNSPTNLPIKQP